MAKAGKTAAMKNDSTVRQFPQETEEQNLFTLALACERFTRLSLDKPAGAA